MLPPERNDRKQTADETYIKPADVVFTANAIDVTDSVQASCQDAIFFRALADVDAENDQGGVSNKTLHIAEQVSSTVFALKSLQKMISFSFASKHTLETSSSWSAKWDRLILQENKWNHRAVIIVYQFEQR